MTPQRFRPRNISILHRFSTKALKTMRLSDFPHLCGSACVLTRRPFHLDLQGRQKGRLVHFSCLHPAISTWDPQPSRRLLNSLPPEHHLQGEDDAKGQLRHLRNGNRWSSPSEASVVKYLLMGAGGREGREEGAQISLW